MGEVPSWDKALTYTWDRTTTDGRRPYGEGPIMGQGLNTAMG